jgi:hypothetical protein
MSRVKSVKQVGRPSGKLAIVRYGNDSVAELARVPSALSRQDHRFAPSSLPR